MRQLPALREAVLASRETLLWVAAYPQPVEGFGFTTSVALGLQEPVRRTLGTSVRLDYAAALAALEADADALAEAFSAVQKEQLGRAEPRTPTTEAMWWDDDDHSDD